MAKRKTNPLADRARAIQVAAQSGGIALDPKARKDQIWDNVQALVARAGAELLIVQSEPKMGRMADGTLMLQIPPPRLTIQLKGEASGPPASNGHEGVSPETQPPAQP
jgi:hypothetical protein